MTEHWCKEHEKAFEKHTKGDKIWYSHKTESGQWCNEPKQEEEKKEEKPKQGSQMSREDWAEKDNVTRKSIERQTSLNAAIELGKILGPDKVSTEKILATAKVFEAYLEGKEVVKSKLVDEVKKITEVKEG